MTKRAEWAAKKARTSAFGAEEANQRCKEHCNQTKDYSRAVTDAHEDLLPTVMKPTVGKAVKAISQSSKAVKKRKAMKANTKTKKTMTSKVHII